MTNSNEENSPNRLEQIESVLLRLTQYQESLTRQQDEDYDKVVELRKLIQSNNKFLEGFSASVAEMRTGIKELSTNVDRLADEVRFTQRQMREILHRVDTNSTNIRDLTADIRELYQENQRILRHLEGRQN